MAPHSPDSVIVEKYTQESYEESVRKICEPHPPRGADEDKDLEDFIDSGMATASKSLEAAAAAFALGGLAFPPAAVVGVALGIGAAVLSFFDSQNKMKVLLDKLTDHIYKVRRQMNSGFDDLEELITKNDFLSEVVSPSNELFAAYIRYVKNFNEADKKEFIECCEVRSSGGIHIIRTMIAKIDRYTDANFVKKSQIARHFVLKEYVDTVMYVYKSLLDVMIAHTFYYTIMSEDEREKKMKEDGLMRLMSEVESKLQGVYEWRRDSYFTHDNLEPIIYKITADISNNGNPSKEVLKWLKESYPWNDSKDKFVAIVWTHHDSRLYEEHLSAPNAAHTIKFPGLKNKNGKKKSMVIHRMTEVSTKNVNIGARELIGTKLKKKLINKDVEKAWNEIPVATDGFSLVLYWAIYAVTPSDHQWDCQHWNSDGFLPHDYFAEEVRVYGGPFTNKRYYCLFYKY